MCSVCLPQSGPESKSMSLPPSLLSSLPPSPSLLPPPSLPPPSLLPPSLPPSLPSSLSPSLPLSLPPSPLPPSLPFITYLHSRVQPSQQPMRTMTEWKTSRNGQSLHPPHYRPSFWHDTRQLFSRKLSYRLKPVTLCSRQMLYQLSYRGSSVGWAKSHIQSTANSPSTKYHVKLSIIFLFSQSAVLCPQVSGLSQQSPGSRQE